MYGFDYQRRPAAPPPWPTAARRPLPGRRPKPHPGDEAAPRRSRAPGRPRRHRRSERHQGRRNGVTIGAMTTHAAVAAQAEVRRAIPALAELAGGIGDPDGAQHGHDRRLDRERRSGRVLPGRASWASARRCRPTSARSPPTSSSPACTRPRSQPGELITAVELSGGAEGGLRQVQAAGVALRADRRVRQPERGGRARRRHRRQGQRVPGPADRGRAREELHPRGREGGEDADRRHQQRHARLGRVPRRDDQRDGVAGGGGSARPVTPAGSVVGDAAPFQGARAAGLRRRRRDRLAARGRRTTSPTAASRPRVFLALKLQRPLFLEGEAGRRQDRAREGAGRGARARSCCACSATRASTSRRPRTSGTTRAR